MATPATVLRGTSGRSVEQAVSYSVGHRFRIEILAALHEGAATAAELSRVLRVPLSNLGHHIEQLRKQGSIEVVDTRQVGNVTQNVYCAVKLPEYTSEEFEEMDENERQATLAIILQASMAEALASLWAGKLVSDPRVMLAWNRINLDAEGREELAQEQDGSWLRIKDIEARSANRKATSGEQGKTYVVTSFGYERSRSEAPTPIKGDRG
jgi:DNA-binding transcriptional ArsR family regulator